MPGADLILNKIRDDARNEASTTLSDARTRADELKYHAQTDVAIARERSLKEAEAVAIQSRDRLIRMAQLDARKERLAMQRTLIQSAFSQAQGKLSTMEGASKKNIFTKMLITSAQGGEELCPAQADAALFDEAMIKALNDSLSLQGKEAVRLGAPSDQIQDGFMLVKGGMQCNCSLAALLEQERNNLEAEVARALFPVEGQ